MIARCLSTWRLSCPFLAKEGIWKFACKLDRNFKTYLFFTLRKLTHFYVSVSEYNSPNCLRTRPFFWHVHWLLVYVRVGLEAEQKPRKWRLPSISCSWCSQSLALSTDWLSVWLHTDSWIMNSSMLLFHLFPWINLTISMVSGNVISV